MTNKSSQQAEKLEPLTEQLEANQAFYETAAENAISQEVKEIFEARAHQRARFAETLLNQSWQEIEEAEVDGGVVGKLSRGITTIKAAMTIERDKTDHVLLEDAYEEEEELLEAYRQVLSEKLPENLQETLEMQYAQVQAVQANLATLIAPPDEEMVLGLFETVENADQAIRALNEAGFAEDKISLLAREEAVESLVEDRRTKTAKESAGAAAVAGGTIGGLIGLVAGASTALIMGIGTVITGGALAAAIGVTAAGVGIGASYGGLFGALIGWGIAEDDVKSYIEGVRRGEVLVAIQAEPGRKDEAAKILQEAEAHSVTIRTDEV